MLVGEHPPHRGLAEHRDEHRLAGHRHREHDAEGGDGAAEEHGRARSPPTAAPAASRLPRGRGGGDQAPDVLADLDVAEPRRAATPRPSTAARTTAADHQRRSTKTAAALASQTRRRRGSKRSWLLIEPLFQSWPAKVVPSSIVEGGQQADHGEAGALPLAGARRGAAA